MTPYFKEYALKLFELGYKPFPITPGAKTPYLSKGESWNDEITLERVKEWAANGKGGGGIGVTNIAAFDFDVHDKNIATKVVKRIKEDVISDLIFRVGESPKFLIPVGQGSEISKKQKHAWYWPDGRKEELELLPVGESHYFVAYGRHPCGSDYKWLLGEILNVKCSDLPVVDELDITQIIDIWDEECKAAGLTQEKPATVADDENIFDSTPVNSSCNSPASPSLHPLADVKTPEGLSIKEIQHYLNVLPVAMCDNRDDWIKVGAAIHHETQGSDEGFELFDTWSQKSSKYKDENDTRGRWESFSLSKVGRSAATIRTIVNAAKMHFKEESKKEDKVEITKLISTGKTYREDIEAAEDQVKLRSVICEMRKDSELDNLLISELSSSIQKKAKSFGVTWRLSDIRNDIRPKIKNSGLPVGDNAPDWVKGWYYLANQDQFCQPETGAQYARGGFKGLYGREMEILSELTDCAFMEADVYALNKARIPTVHDVMYCPSCASETFSFEEKIYVNSYSPSSHGERTPKSQWTPEDALAVQFFKDHIKQMFQLEGEAELVLNTLAYICQKGALQRLEWMLIIKGCEGDGKTAMLDTIANCVGTKNAGIIHAEEIVEHNFTDWADGDIFKRVEELKMPDKNRYVTLNKCKPYITNPVISVHPKGRKARKVINTASYVATTNFIDCLPLSDESRRYSIVQSQWGNKNDVKKAYGDDYFTRLFDAKDNHTSAINEFLMTYEIPDYFNPFDAPDTPSKREVILLSASEATVALNDIIESGLYKDINSKIIDTKKLAEVLAFEYDITLNSSALSKCILALGYKRIPWQIKINGDVRRVYVSGIKITKDRKSINNQIRDIIELPF